MSKTINEALADLITGLGESSSVLSDNATVSDYIEDLSDAIKKCAASEAGTIIDDTAASSTKTYSSNKIVELTAKELPSVSGSDNGKFLGVSSGAWATVDAPAALPSLTAYDDGKLLVAKNRAWVTASNIITTGISSDKVMINSDSAALVKLFRQNTIIYAGNYCFRYYQQNNYDHTFMCIERGTNQTKYHTIVVNENSSEMQRCDITTETVNDPAT